MPRQFEVRGKRRTREHVIADLSANHVEKQALLCGFTVQRWVYDYGIDLVLSTYTDEGETEGGFIVIQIKFREFRNRIMAQSDGVIHCD